MSKYAQVIVDCSAQALDRIFSYGVPEGMALSVGQQVRVPFGSRTVEGFVVGLTDECELPEEKLRAVAGPVQDYPVILPELIDLARWMHRRYLCNFVDTLRLMIPSEMRGGRVHILKRRRARLAASQAEVDDYIAAHGRAPKQIELLRLLLEGERDAAVLNPSALKALADRGLVEVVESEKRRAPSALRSRSEDREFELMPGQKRAVDAITDAMARGGGRFLLNGVTGSGKTEVYMRCIRRALDAGRGAIVLVPEIALTPQMVGWFRARFGDEAALLHSGLSAGERFDEWRRIRFGEARVVVGARSAIFAPMEDIGIIIVDEEHENTYQSEKRPCYEAREVAQYRADAAGAALVLGSATPSVKSFMRCLPGVRPENRLTLLEMSRRVQGRPLPQVDLVDMREEFADGNHSIFSAKLATALRDCLSAGRQAILFINRRGHSTFVSCRKCGFVLKCEQCDVSMTYHQAGELMKCHYCGAALPPPKSCPQCGSPYIRYFGAGTQKVAEETQKLFPDARIVRMDVDTTREKDAHEKLLERFRSGAANVLIGTQMVAKGLDFPNVTLVGVIAADMTLNLPDYRSAERTFQLVTQVAGRAGRAEQPGRVVVQTYDPQHYAIQNAVAQDYRAFFQKESAFRKNALYPPYTEMLRIVYSGRDQEAVAAQSSRDAEELDKWIDREGHRLSIVKLKEQEAPIGRLRGEFRRQIFVKMYFKGDKEAVCRKMLALAEASREGVRAELEVNPVNML